MAWIGDPNDSGLMICDVRPRALAVDNPFDVTIVSQVPDAPRALLTPDVRATVQGDLDLYVAIEKGG